jgi:hypothetical protein
VSVITELTELWNRIKNSYPRHSHKRLRPHLHIKIRIVNMQKYVDVVVDVCGNGDDTNFLCDSTVR